VSYLWPAVVVFVFALESSVGPNFSPTPDPMETASPASDAIVPLDRPFALEVGEAAFLEDGLKVVFESVVGDSRCPSDVECVWEGNAEISIAVSQNLETPALLSLNSNPGFATEVTYLSYVVTLIVLEPYPRADSVTGEPYRATLLVVDSNTVLPSPIPLTS